MPLKYLTSPNGRIFYMLKTFTIKQLDVFRNESVSKIAEGIKRKDNRIILEGIRNLVYLAGLFIMANAGADELKDWLFGRKPSFSDKVWDNILRLFGLSRFIVWETRRAGPVKAFWKLITPPMDVIEAPLKDVQNFLKDDEIGTDLKIKNAETWKMIPFIGKHYYWWFGGGKESENKKQEKDNPYAKYIRGVRQRKAKYTKIAKAGYKRELDARKKGNAKKAEKIKKETAEKKARIIKERDSFVKKNKKEAFDYKKTLNENID
jgi:hypothetical protein